MTKASENLKGDFMQPARFFKNTVRRFENAMFQICRLSFIGLVLLGSCTLINANASSASKELTTGANIISKTPTNVEVKEIRLREYIHELAYCGTIEESETIPLCFSVLGIVSKVLVSEGEKVKTGQLLATLDNANYKNMYDMAAAKEKQAEDAYSRLRRMYKNGSLPEIKMIEVETGLQEARSAAAIAMKNLKSCDLYATADGLIGRRAIEPGTGITSSLASLTIVKIDKLYTRVPVPENEIALIEKGQKAFISIPALDFAADGNKRAGVVEVIGVIADPLAHTYRVKIIISNDDGKIRPGMVARVTISQSAKSRGASSKLLLVPNNAVLVDETGENFIFVADISHMRAMKKHVNTGALLKDGIEIIQGLDDGDQVIVSGQHKLEDHSPIEIVR